MTRQDTAENLEDGAGNQPLRRFLLALSLYGLWCGLAWLSNVLGQTVVDARSAIILVGGISATNALFFSIARAGSIYQPSDSSITTAQCMFGIVWATFYAYFSVGSGELLLGIYITTMLYAIFQVSNTTFTSLTGFAVLSYIGVIVTKGILTPDTAVFWRDSLSLLAFAGVMWWVLIYARHIHGLKEQLHDRNFELQEMVQKVSRVAERDHLTKSFNRHYIMESLSREKGRADRSNNPFSICIFDLDHFKAMNDDHGHLVGDRILRSFAKRVRAELRTMDAVNRSEHRRSFGRFGGEEFIAILPSTSLNGAERCAERIRKSIDEKLFYDVYKVTSSVGVAEYKRGETIPQLLARADEALYKAKETGRNKVCLSESKKNRQGKSAQVMDLRHRAGAKITR